MEEERAEVKEEELQAQAEPAGEEIEGPLTEAQIRQAEKERRKNILFFSFIGFMILVLIAGIIGLICITCGPVATGCTCGKCS